MNRNFEWQKKYTIKLLRKMSETKTKKKNFLNYQDKFYTKNIKKAFDTMCKTSFDRAGTVENKTQKNFNDVQDKYMNKRKKEHLFTIIDNSRRLIRVMDGCDKIKIVINQYQSLSIVELIKK